MRLASSYVTHYSRLHNCINATRLINVVTTVGREMARWIAGVCRPVVATTKMRVGRHLTHAEGMTLRTGPLTLSVTVADVNRDPALQIRQSKIHSPVTAIHGPQQRKQRLVLIDRHQLSIAHGPALRRKIKTENPYLA